jgi:CRISPR-associated protein Cas1
MQDLHLLPKLRDSLTYLYVEHAVLERRDNALLVLQETGKTAVPVADLCVLMLGPGTNVTHAAIKLLAENGCSVLWTGEDMEHFYAQGLGETRRAYHLLRQAELVGNLENRLKVVFRMYEKRFGHVIDPTWTMDQVQGFEGVRMRTAYAEASRKYNVEWKGRNYDRHNWANADPVNRALSAGNALLNGLCHAAIVSGGYSPALGFIHTGRQLSFVYDIADLYKVRFTIPIAFETIAESIMDVEKRARQTCRERFREEKLLQLILPDIDNLLQINEDYLDEADPNEPTPWWNPEDGTLPEDDQEEESDGENQS